MLRVSLTCCATVVFGLTAAQALAADRSPELVYRNTCGYCHGANVGPIILGRNLPADGVTAIVRSGLNSMPAFRPTEINDAELRALARWISTSKADPKDHGQ